MEAEKSFIRNLHIISYKKQKDTETKKFKQAAGEPDKRVRRLYGSVYELYVSELRCGIRRIPD